MSEQNLKNHHRYIILWHLIVPLIMLGLLIAGIINLVKAGRHEQLISASLVAIAVLFIIFYWYTRSFALKAQDRAIRAEENFRHYILTGKPHDKSLRLGQIIALRFASDEEMPALAKKAIEEKLTQKEIKRLIKSWRRDRHRV